MAKGKIAGGIVLLILGTIFTSFGYIITNQCSSFGGQKGRGFEFAK
jgi:hypothetical protein